MRPETIVEIAHAESIDIGARTASELCAKLRIGEPAPSLPAFLAGFAVTCAVLQTKEAIERIAFELAEDAANENVRYLEIRFSPLLCTRRGLSPEDALRAAQRG